MKLTIIASTSSCPDGRVCPTKYLTDRGTVVIQGNKLVADELAEMGMPEHETAVEIPTDDARELGLVD
jgi:hypothetical protein